MLAPPRRRHASPSHYAALLLDAGLAVDAWETTYLHRAARRRSSARVGTGHRPAARPAALSTAGRRGVRGRVRGGAARCLPAGARRARCSRSVASSPWHIARAVDKLAIHSRRAHPQAPAQVRSLTFLTAMVDARPLQGDPLHRSCTRGTADVSNHRCRTALPGDITGTTTARVAEAWPRGCDAPVGWARLPSPLCWRS